MSHIYYATTVNQWFDEQKECDVKFSCPDDSNDCSEKSTIGAHKLVLSMSSDVFFAMFYGPMSQTSDASKNVIDISDIKFSTFKMLLSFIYLKTIQFETVKIASEFYYAAEKYNCKDALELVVDHFINFTEAKDFIYIYETNYLHDNDQLKNACLKTFSEKCDKILRTDEFLSAYLKTIETIFGLETLAIQSEMDLVEALERYIEHNKTNDPHIVAKVRPALNSIRFLTLKREDICKTSLLTSNEKEAIEACLLPGGNQMKMPKGFSICTKKRHFVEAVLQMIRQLTNVYSSKICYRCANRLKQSNHAVWDCHTAGAYDDVLANIFKKYNHTSLMEYDRLDLEAVYKYYKHHKIL